MTTNLKSFLSMLDEAKLPYTTETDGVGESWKTTVTLEVDRDRIEGYSGFCAVFLFFDGRLVKVGIWE